MNSFCCTCGKIHDEWPSLEFCSPFYYSRLTKLQKQKAKIDDDFCVIRTGRQADHFIRAIISQKVNDHCDTLEYAVWILLTKESYEDYQLHYDEVSHDAVYFGMLSNQLPGYKDTLSVQVSVYTKNDMMRPEVIPHQGQQSHAFVRDYYNGISATEVEEKIRLITE